MAPISSGIKLVNPLIVKDFEDLSDIEYFSGNENKIQDINCYIFFIHGLCDKVIAPSHSVLLAKKKGNLTTEWYPKKGGHKNIIYSHRDRFYEKCTTYIDQLRILKDPMYNSYSNSNCINFLNVRNTCIRFQENYIKSNNNNNNNKNEKNETIENLSNLVRNSLKSSSNELNFEKPLKSKSNLKFRQTTNFNQSPTTSEDGDKRSTSHGEVIIKVIKHSSSDFGMRFSKDNSILRDSKDSANFEIDEKQYFAVIGDNDLIFS